MGAATTALKHLGFPSHFSLFFPAVPVSQTAPAFPESLCVSREQEGLCCFPSAGPTAMGATGGESASTGGFWMWGDSLVCLNPMSCTAAAPTHPPSHRAPWPQGLLAAPQPPRDHHNGEGAMPAQAAPAHPLAWQRLEGGPGGGCPKSPPVSGADIEAGTDMDEVALSQTPQPPAGLEEDHPPKPGCCLQAPPAQTFPLPGPGPNPGPPHLTCPHTASWRCSTHCAHLGSTWLHPGAPPTAGSTPAVPAAAGHRASLLASAPAAARPSCGVQVSPQIREGMISIWESPLPFTFSFQQPEL